MAAADILGTGTAHTEKGKPGLFIFAVALTLINNFYFAYYQLIISIIYLMIRLIFRRKNDMDRKAVIKRTVPSAVLGFGISDRRFLPCRQGFTDSDSREYDVEVPFLKALARRITSFMKII